MFVTDLTDPRLSDSDAHHLVRVLRLRPGEVVTTSDGRGSWRRFVFAGVRTDRHGDRVKVTLEAAGAIEQVVRLRPEITVAFSLQKGSRPEWVTQKLTEVGVDRVVPLLAARSVARWAPERVDQQLGRLRRIARETAMQARRVWLPEVEDLVSFADLVVQPDVRDHGVMAHRDGEAPTLDRSFILIGPEGGWSSKELACGLPTVSLGSTVLRAETAGIAAGILLCGLRCGIVSRGERPSLGEAGS